MTDILSPPGEWTPGAIHHHFSILLGEIERTTSTHFADLQAQIDRRISSSQHHAEQSVSAVRESILAQKEWAKLEHEYLRRMTEKLEGYVEKRLYESNQFREQIMRERGDYMPRETIEARFGQQEEKIAALERTATQRAGAEMEKHGRFERVQPWQLALATLATMLFTTAVVVVANILTG